MNNIVLQNLESGLLTITMNRPDRRNALNPEMTLGLVEAARRAAEDHEVRAVLLKGAGGTFCVGGDVKSMAEGRAPMPFEAKMTNLRDAGYQGYYSAEHHSAKDEYAEVGVQLSKIKAVLQRWNGA